MLRPRLDRLSARGQWTFRTVTMKEFSCGDVVPGCKAHFHARSEREILEQVAAHARADHGMSDVPAEVVSAVLERIRETSVV